MNEDLIDKIAKAVLYEGYLLYPYRPSALKNRQRWNFGIIYPKAYSDLQKGADSCVMQTECLLQGGESAAVDVRVRFLHAVQRHTGKGSASDAGVVESLDSQEGVAMWGQEAVERKIAVPQARLAELAKQSLVLNFDFPAERRVKRAEDDRDAAAQFVVRTCETIQGRVELRTAECAHQLYKLTIMISNCTPLEDASLQRRESVLAHSLLSTHTIFGASGAEFMSLIDPPPDLRGAAATCKNVGTWPVLVGEERATDAMLSSPIILYDYPSVAPESPGDLFDATEIDEILALRILTLSEEEKREIRRTDDQARAVLERTEALPVEHFLKLHGALRGLKRVANGGNDANHEGET